MERSFFLKKRRADFVAGSLSGRVIVAGGLGKDGAVRLLLRVGCLVDTWRLREQEKVLAASCTLPAYHFNPNNSKHALPRIHKRVPMCSFHPLTQGN